MKKIYALFLSLFFTINLPAQFPTHQWSFNLTNYYIMSSTEDSNGDVYIVGRFQGTQDFDPGPGTTTLTAIGQWGYIAKFSSTGNFIWVKAISHSNSSGQVWVRKIKVDNSNNIYVVGDLYTSGVDFDPGPGTANLPCPTAGLSNSDAFVAKYDVNGNYQWAQTIYNTAAANTTEIAIDLVIDDANNKVRVSSQTTTTSGGNTLRYAQDAPCFFNVPGNFSLLTYGAVFTYSMSNGTGIAPGNESSYNHGSQPPYLDIDNSGNYYIARWNNGSPQSLQITKTAPTGTVVWSRTISNGPGNNIQPADIALDPSDNIYVYGKFSATMDFDASATTSLVTSNSNSYDVFLVEYSNAGNFVWVGTFGSNNPEDPRSMDVFKGTGNIYLTGDFAGTIDVDFGASVATLTASAVITNLVKYDVNRNHIWSTTMPNATSIWDIYASKQDNLFLSGINFGTYDMNFSASVNNISNGGFVAKYSNCTTAPTAPGSINGINSICNGAGSTTYSVASILGATSYTWSLPGGWTGTSTTNTISATPGMSGGNISVTASNACGTSSASVLNVTVNAQPTITVNNGTICSGQSFVMITSGANTYTFSSGSATVSPVSSANYSVTGTSSAGCISSNTAISSVVVNTTPTVSVNSGSICTGSSFTITPSGASTYTIQGGSLVVNPSSNTTYTVRGTSSAGCVSANTATCNVTVVNSPTANAGTSQTITCVLSSVSLNGSGVSTYTWSGPGIVSGGNTASPIVNMAGTYSLVGSTSGCNSNTAIVIVSTNTIAPTVTANTSSSIICGPPFQGFAILTASGASTYSWNTSATTTTITVSPSVTTQYTVTGTNATNGCTNSIVFTQSVSACTGINMQTTNPELTIYPNPTSGVITIKAKEGLPILVYNIIGELILSTELTTDTIELDLSNQANGIYFIRIGSVTKKIIKG